MKYSRKFCTLMLTLIFANANTVHSIKDFSLKNDKMTLYHNDSQVIILKSDYLSRENELHQCNSFCQIVNVTSSISKSLNRKGNDIIYDSYPNLNDLRNFIIYEYENSDILRSEKRKLILSKSILKQILNSIIDFEKSKVSQDSIYNPNVCIKEINDNRKINFDIFNISKTFDNNLCSYQEIDTMDDLEQSLESLKKVSCLLSTCFNKKSKKEFKIKEFHKNLKYIQYTVSDINKILSSEKLQKILCDLKSIYNSSEINIPSTQELILLTKSKILGLLSDVVKSFGKSTVSNREVINQLNEIRKLFKLKSI